MAADLTGRVLAYVQTGPASPNRSDRALENVQQAVRDVVLRSGCSLEDDVALVAGIAGLDSPGGSGVGNAAFEKTAFRLYSAGGWCAAVICSMRWQMSWQAVGNGCGS